MMKLKKNQILNYFKTIVIKKNNDQIRKKNKLKGCFGVSLCTFKHEMWGGHVSWDNIYYFLFLQYPCCYPIFDPCFNNFSKIKK
jgi:hypothetical protein